MVGGSAGCSSVYADFGGAVRDRHGLGLEAHFLAIGKVEVRTMLRTTVVTLALTTGLIWGMVGCSTLGKKDAPLDMYLGQVQSQPRASGVYPAEWSPMTLPPIQMSGLGLA